MFGKKNKLEESYINLENSLNKLSDNYNKLTDYLEPVTEDSLTFVRGLRAEKERVANELLTFDKKLYEAKKPYLYRLEKIKISSLIGKMNQSLNKTEEFVIDVLYSEKAAKGDAAAMKELLAGAELKKKRIFGALMLTKMPKSLEELNNHYDKYLKLAKEHNFDRKEAERAFRELKELIKKFGNAREQV